MVPADLCSFLRSQGSFVLAGGLKFDAGFSYIVPAAADLVGLITNVLQAYGDATSFALERVQQMLDIGRDAVFEFVQFIRPVGEVLDVAVEFERALDNVFDFIPNFTSFLQSLAQAQTGSNSFARFATEIRTL